VPKQRDYGPGVFCKMPSKVSLSLGFTSSNLRAGNRVKSFGIDEVAPPQRVDPWSLCHTCAILGVTSWFAVALPRLSLSSWEQLIARLVHRWEKHQTDIQGLHFGVWGYSKCYFPIFDSLDGYMFMPAKLSFVVSYKYHQMAVAKCEVPCVQCNHCINTSIAPVWQQAF